MNIEIYYFTGTGNSFVVAKDISYKTGAKLVPIASVMDMELIKPEADCIGIIYPDYHSNVPNIVRRFINKLVIESSTYIFGITTFGGSSPGISLDCLKELIEKRGGNLSFGSAVRMPYNYIIPCLKKNSGSSIKLNPQNDDEQTRMFDEWKIRLESICLMIEKREKGTVEKKSVMLFRIIDFLNVKNTLGKYMWMKMAGYKGKTPSAFADSIRLMDHGFTSNTKCNRCGTCSKVCPVINIVIEDNGPLWLHKCEQCFACLQWCPQEAINFGANKIPGKRYHHPDVNVNDMIQQKH
jgi:ferredoxin